MVGKPSEVPTIEHVHAAAARLVGKAVLTPLLFSPSLSERCCRPVYLKPECLQRTGSFKFRGAFNRISQLPAGPDANGLVAMSSGNHAQGVAAAAAICGHSATIVMPSDAPAIKLQNTRALGASIVTYDRQNQDRDRIAREIVEESGGILVTPFDDPDIISGQGTVGLEIAQDAENLGVHLETVVIPAGGGGLAAGTSLAIKALSPDTEVFVAEPQEFDDHARSLIAGERCVNKKMSGSICDALLALSPGELTFEINRKTLTGGVVVSDTETANAVGLGFRDLNLVIEPGGAVALAAVLEGKLPHGKGAVVIVISGGNIDAALFCRLVGTDQEKSAS